MEKIIQILRDYQDYSEKSPELKGDIDIAKFGKYLTEKYSDDVSSFKTDQEEVNTQNLDVMLSYLLGGLSLYLETWLKISYKDIPVRSLGDFSILMAVKTQNKPTKKDIYTRVVMEQSTCMEAIKRLTKAGLFVESENPTDKRSKIVELTPYGREIIEKLNQKMIALSNLITGELSPVEKQQLFVLLKKLSQFHKSLYQSETKMEIQERFSL